MSAVACMYYYMTRLRAVSLFSVVRRAKREKRKWPRAWLMARDGRGSFFFSGCRPRFARLAASPLPRACIAPTKSEEKERLLAVYYMTYSLLLLHCNTYLALWRHFPTSWGQLNTFIAQSSSIVGFHMMSLKFKLQTYRSYGDFTFMVY